MLTDIYLAIGAVFAVVAVIYFWARVTERSRGRLVLLVLAVALAWPGLGLLALADKKRTTVDYISQWLERTK